MARGRRKNAPVSDPKRRAYLAAMRTAREQVLREFAQELGQAGFLRRILLRMRIEREVKARTKDVQAQPPTPKKRGDL